MSIASIERPDLDPGIYRVADLDWLRQEREFGVELIDGEVWMTPAPTPDHQSIAGEVYSALRSAVQLEGKGRVFYAPLDVILDQRTALNPDVVVVLADRLSLIGPRRVEGAPSLVVEVVSPGSRRMDSVEKRGRYARGGVPEYWLIDPSGKQAIRYSDPVDGAYRDVVVLNHDEVIVSATIDGLSVELAHVFAGGAPA